MKEQSKIIEFNLNSNDIDRENPTIFEHIRQNINLYPQIYLLFTDISQFCKDNFSEILEKIVREKRQLDFETPNRLKITHEYTLNQKGLRKDFYYLFTPSGRLDWLKIHVENERVSVADKSLVKDKIFKIIKEEYNLICSNYSTMNEATFIDNIYDSLKGLPCFIEYNNSKRISDQLSCLIIVEYMTSIQRIKPKNKFLSSFINPIIQKQIHYNYKPLSNKANSWLYLKAPKSFELECSTNENKDIDSPHTTDPEICSYVLKSSGQDLNVDFNICIKAPKSLSVWFLSLFHSANLLIILLLISLFDKINIFSNWECLHSLCFINDWFIKNNTHIIINTGFALIAGIIATRGWLIVEENILKRISIGFTLQMMVLFALTITVSILK